MQLIFYFIEFQKMFDERREKNGVNNILVFVEQINDNILDYSLKFKKGVFMI